MKFGFGLCQFKEWLPSSGYSHAKAPELEEYHYVFIEGSTGSVESGKIVEISTLLSTLT